MLARLRGETFEPPTAAWSAVGEIDDHETEAAGAEKDLGRTGTTGVRIGVWDVHDYEGREVHSCV
jgi:hypothetical protein